MLLLFMLSLFSLLLSLQRLSLMFICCRYSMFFLMMSLQDVVVVPDVVLVAFVVDVVL